MSVAGDMRRLTLRVSPTALGSLPIGTKASASRGGELARGAAALGGALARIGVDERPPLCWLDELETTTALCVWYVNVGCIIVTAADLPLDTGAIELDTGMSAG